MTYFTPTSFPKAAFSISGFNTLTSPQPITAISLLPNAYTVEGLKAFLETAEGDDVWSKEFLAAVYMNCIGEGCVISDEVAGHLAEAGTKALILDSSVTSSSTTLSTYAASASSTASNLVGPYLASMNSTTLSLYPAYRLYHDRLRTFVFGAYPKADGSGDYMAFDRVTTEFGDPWIPVPSRLYSNGEEGILAGQRIAIKGTSVSNSNRST